MASNRNQGYTAEEIYAMDEPYMEHFAYQQWDEEWPADQDEPYHKDTFNAQNYDETEVPDATCGKDAPLQEAYAFYFDASSRLPVATSLWLPWPMEVDNACQPDPRPQGHLRERDVAKESLPAGNLSIESTSKWKCCLSRKRHRMPTLGTN